MTKNIILCADGTGNKGGYTPDSNVYKMYQAIEIHDTKIPQYTFYDNGVGTSTNKIWRAISGGIGAGIKRNIMELYVFLALNYVPGDKVYVFGFSRGAATIRALCDFINTVGLVDGKELDDDILRDYTKEAFDVYSKHEVYKQIAINFYSHPNSHGKIPIHFIGVWDTVSAIGLPKRTDKMGVGLNVLTYLFDKLDTFMNTFWPHQFYKYELNENIKNAYQALAIDDERTAFWPHVWNENGRKGGIVEQVWFSGMHSNVGGGYERQGMANVTLHWMMLRAIKHGLTLKPSALDKAYKDSNIHGRLYNSRDGLAVYYRYHPRDIKTLCKGKLIGNIKIHSSVVERMKKKTANYTPFVLPNKFDITESKPTEAANHCDFSDDENWRAQNKLVSEGINVGKKSYGRLVDISLFIFVYFLYVWNEDISNGESFFNTLLDLAIGGISVNNVFEQIMENHLPLLALVSAALIVLYKSRTNTYAKMIHAAESIRHLIVNKIK